MKLKKKEKLFKHVQTTISCIIIIVFIIGQQMHSGHLLCALHVCIYIYIYLVYVSLQVQVYLEPFRLSLEKLQEVSARLKKDLIRGLGKHTHQKAAVKMLPTFVRATPDGTGEAGCMDEWRRRYKALNVFFLI